MGFTRDTFCLYQSAVEAGGIEGLIDANRKKSNLKTPVEALTANAAEFYSLDEKTLEGSRPKTAYQVN